MTRILSCLLLVAVCGNAAADSLSEANRLLEAKAYGEAFPVLRMLADGGNAEARFKLGQMYWYGHGLPADRAKADALFAQAAAGGNKEAADALALTRRREARSAEIARWTAGYDGADLTSGKYACAQPAIPDVSKTNDEIKATTTAFQAWSSCYNGFVADLDGPLAPAARVPADLAVLMSDAERQQALAHVSGVTQGVLDKVGASAGPLMARYDNWEKATQAFAAEHNATVEARKKQDAATLDIQSRMRAGAMAAGPSSPVPQSKGK
jgi:TPR repeat protein